MSQHCLQNSLPGIFRLSTLQAAIAVATTMAALAATAAPAEDSGTPAATPATASTSHSDTELAEIVVTATAPEATTENSGSYTSNAVTIGKGTQSRKEVPQSISVITRQRMDDQNLVQVQDVVKQTTGMMVQRFDGANLFSSYYSRGYQVDSIQLDGLTFGNSGNVTEFDTAIYDRVEVLRGPAGLFQGSGEPSASINLARKRATADPQLQGSITAGSWNTTRADVDVSSKLDSEGRLRGRAVAVYDHRENFTDVIETERHTVYGTLEYDVSLSTTLSVGITQQKIDSGINQGLPAYANGRMLDVDTATFIGANWNEQQLDSTDYFAELEHRLDNGGQVKLAARHLDRFMLYKGARANGAVTAAGNTAIQNVYYSPDRDNDSADLYLSTPFELGGQKHNFLIGADWRNQDEVADAAYALPTLQNVFNPDHNLPMPVFNQNVSTTTSDQTQYGVYSQLRLKPVDKLTVMLGGRESWFSAETRNLTTGQKTGDYSQNGEFTPYAGLVVDITPAVSAYGSFADIFQPQNNIDASGQQLPPRTGKQFEVGVKGGFMQGRLTPQLAVFRINDKNRAIDDPNSSNVNHYIASGEVQSEGYEAEISGEVLPGWDLSTGYAYTRTEFLTAPTASQNGDVFSTATPRNNFNLWTRYRFQEGLLSRLSIGGGARSVSSFYAQSGSTKFVAEGYTVVSAQVACALSKNLEASLTGNNLFNEKYYEKVSGSGRQNFYGEPRSAMLTLRARY